MTIQEESLAMVAGFLFRVNLNKFKLKSKILKYLVSKIDLLLKPLTIWGWNYSRIVQKTIN